MEIEVHKFGGASLANPDGVKRMGAIVQQLYKGKKLLFVVSAMGKTTNALEHALSVALKHGDLSEALRPIETLHNEMLSKLELEPEATRNVARLPNDLGVLQRTLHKWGSRSNG